MKAEGASLGFEPVAQRHLPLLRSWLEAPHMREWWGEPEKELGFIRDMIAGRDTTRPFLILLDGEPVGYIQCWFVGHHQNRTWMDENPWLAELPAEAVGVDLSIGRPEMLSRGVGSAALAAFTRKLLEEGHTTIIIDPDSRNLRAVRAYMKAGFRPVPHLEGRTGDTLIMQYDPQADETTT